MKVYVVIKNSYIPNRDDEPHREFVDIDCVKATKDGAYEKMKELIRSGYRGADYRETWLT